jgi:hypothetical protein
MQFYIWDPHTKHLIFSRQSAQERFRLPVAHTVTPHATKWRRRGHDCAVCTNTAVVSRHTVTHMAVNSDLVPFVLQVPGQIWVKPEWKRDNKLFIRHLAVCCQASLQHQVANIPASISGPILAVQGHHYQVTLEFWVKSWYFRSTRIRVSRYR